MRVVIATEQPDSADASDSMSAMGDHQNKEDFPDYPVDLSKDDKEKSEVVEITESKDECGPKLEKGNKEEEEEEEKDVTSDNGDRETWMPVSSSGQPSPALSPPLLDLSLKRSSAGFCESGLQASEDSDGVKANLKTLLGHKFAEKRKMTDSSSEVLLKRQTDSPQIRSGFTLA